MSSSALKIMKKFRKMKTLPHVVTKLSRLIHDENSTMKDFEDVIKMDQRLGSWEVSLEKPIKDDSSSRSVRDLLPGSTKPADEKLGDNQLRSLIRQKLQTFRDTLEGREREIFDERLMAQNPLTLKDLGDRYGITKERTRQLEARLLEKIRDHLVREIPDAEEIIPEFLTSISS